MIYDLPRLYFDNISGVRLDPLINFQGSSEKRRADADIVRAHTRLVNACCQSLFEWGREGSFETKPGEETVVKHDMMRLAGVTHYALRHLIDGGMNMQYKFDYEAIAKPLVDSGIRFVHLCISKFHLLKNDKNERVTDIFEGMFAILIDSIASRLSLDFIESMKDSLIYEISLVN